MSFSYKPLFKLLIDRDIKPNELRKKISAGPATFAHFAKGENVSMDVLDRICIELDVPLSAIVEHVKPGKE